MDPLSALGVAASAVQFVDFAWGLFRGARSVWSAATGSQENIKQVKDIAEKLRTINDDLISSSSDPALRSDEKELCRACNTVANELIRALERLSRKSGSKWESLAKALLEVWTKEDIDDLIRRIEFFRQQICMSIVVSFRFPSLLHCFSTGLMDC